MKKRCLENNDIFEHKVCSEKIGKSLVFDSEEFLNYPYVMEVLALVLSMKPRKYDNL
jgi:hypothetical protein